MKNDLTTKYGPIIKQASFIAKACGCTDAYVRRIFKGERVAGTERAVLANKVIQFCDALLKTYNEQINNQN